MCRSANQMIVTFFPAAKISVKKNTAALVFLMVSTIVAAASGDVLYDNFGAGDSYITNLGWVIGGTQNFEQGSGITIVGGDFFLESVDAAVTHSQGVNQIELNLYSSNGGLPGTLLESSLLTDLPEFTTNLPPSTFDFSGTTMLQEGESYFLIASGVNDGNSLMIWNWNDTGDIGEILRRENFGAWGIFPDETLPAIRVNASPVPEPGLALFGSIAIGWLVTSRRRSFIRRGTR